MRLPDSLTRHPVRWALLVVTLGVAAAYLVPKTIDASHRMGRLSGGEWLWFAVALAAEIASLVAFSLVTWTLIDPAIRPAFRRVFRLDLATVALSHAVPAGSVAGSGLGYELLEEEGLDGVQAGFVKLSQSLLSGLLLEVMLAFSTFLQLATTGSPGSSVAFTIMGAGLLVLVVGFATLLIHRPTAISRLAVRLLGWVPRVRPESIARVVHALSARMRSLVHAPRLLAQVSLWSLLNWVFDLFSLWAALKAFGAPPPAVLIAVAFCVAQVAAALPVSPGGLGVVESALTPLLMSFGAGASDAVLGVLTWRLLNFWFPLPLGGAAYLGIVAERRRGRRGAHVQSVERSTSMCG